MEKNINFFNLDIIRKKFSNKKIGLAHGVFDLFHYGHLLHLKKAKEYCDILIVSVTADKYVNKAPDRPYYSIKKRLEILKNLNIVDYVVESNHPTAIEIIKKLKPNFYFKGSEYSDYSNDHTGQIKKEIFFLKKNKGKIIFTNEPILSSSNIINNFFSNIPENVKLYLKQVSKKIKFEKIFKVAEAINKKKILVIGDAIIDKYIFCNVLSKSPKEQIMSVEEKKIETYNGGILATANHISNFVKNLTLLTIMGGSKKKNNIYLKNLPKNIKKKIFYQKNASTIIKTRYLDNDNHKVFQKTNLGGYKYNRNIEKQIFEYIKNNIKKFDQVIINDFGHGLLTEKIIKFLQLKSKNLCVNAQTNSANHGYNYITKYKNAFYISIDEPEARLATQQKNAEINKIFLMLKNKINFKLCSITHGKHGTNISNTKKIYFVPALTQSPIDTLGAGDAYFAISSLFSKYFKNQHYFLGLIGNVAASIKIQYIGHSKYLNKKVFFGYFKTILNF